MFGSVADTATDVKAVAKDLGLADPYVPDNKDPQKSADWWKSLTPEQQSNYLALYPDRIGPLDGLPATVRDEANRLALDQQLDQMRAGNARGSGMTSEEYNKREQDLMAVKAALDERDNAAEDKQVFLLGLDTKAYGGDGKAIVAIGNPDTADHTAVMVPGTGTTIASTSGQLARINDMQEAAKQASKGTNQKVSVISWLGYDAPEIPVVQGNLAIAGTTLGGDPMIDRFGGNNFQVDTSGHSGYWDEGSKSLDNQGRIIVGKEPTTVPKNPGPPTK